MCLSLNQAPSKHSGSRAEATMDKCNKEDPRQFFKLGPCSELNLVRSESCLVRSVGCAVTCVDFVTRVTRVGFCVFGGVFVSLDQMSGNT